VAADTTPGAGQSGLDIKKKGRENYQESMMTKEKLFETALKLFSEKGFEATSIRVITRETGLTVASFYNHFKSKDELLQAIYDYYRGLYLESEDIQPDYETLLNKAGPIVLFTFLTEAFLKSMQNEKLVKLSRLIVMEQYTNKTAGEIAFKDRHKLLAAFEAIFTIMGKKGLIRVKDPGVIGRLVGYAYLGFASDNVYYSIMEEKDPQEIVKMQAEIVERFLREILV
jgi:AcrR family transcriptional regulator